MVLLLTSWLAPGRLWEIKIGVLSQPLWIVKCKGKGMKWKKACLND